MAAAVPQDGGSAEAVVDHWHAGDASPQAGSLVLIVTNFSLPACTRSVWHASSLRLVADGGANRLFDELPLLADPGSSPEQVRGRTPSLELGRRCAWKRAARLGLARLTPPS